MCGRISESGKVQFVNARSLFRQDLQGEPAFAETTARLAQDGKRKQGICNPPSARLRCGNLNSHPVDPVKYATRLVPVRLKSRRVAYRGLTLGSRSRAWSWSVKPVWMGYPNPACRADLSRQSPATAGAFAKAGSLKFTWNRLTNRKRQMKTDFITAKHLKCRDMPRYAAICRDMPRYAAICRDMPRYAAICRDRFFGRAGSLLAVGLMPRFVH